jgi:L-asparagine oxygenase
MRSIVERDGFVLQEGLVPHVPTLDLAQRLGMVVDIEKLLPSSCIPTVQTLRPRDTTQVKQNRYSGNFGLDRFPLHTDLAHWVLPPRYLLLRCFVGAEDVYTNLLSCVYAEDVVGKAGLHKAVFRSRRRGLGCSGLVRAMSYDHGEKVFRWDPIFLEPVSRYALALSAAMHDPCCSESQISIRLAKPGDTIIVDNWQMLHGRSEVSSPSTTRHIERVYLSEVFDGS